MLLETLSTSHQSLDNDLIIKCYPVNFELNKNISHAYLLKETLSSHLKFETIFIRTVLTSLQSSDSSTFSQFPMLTEERQHMFIATLIQQSYFSSVKTKAAFEYNCSGTVFV